MGQVLQCDKIFEVSGDVVRRKATDGNLAFRGSLGSPFAPVSLCDLLFSPDGRAVGRKVKNFQHCCHDVYDILVLVQFSLTDEMLKLSSFFPL